MLTKEDIIIGRGIAYGIGGYIGGSVLVNPDDAADFDIFIGWNAWLMNKLDGYQFTIPAYLGGTRLEIKFEDSWNDRSDYYMTNNTDDALRITYRSVCGKYNLIVVNDDFVLAFKVAAKIMAAFPEQYKDRQARIDLHHEWRTIIRTVLSDSFAVHPNMLIVDGLIHKSRIPEVNRTNLQF